MTQQGMPNPIELYEGAIQSMLPILGGVGDKLGASTPCSEWNVQALIMHNIKTAQFAHSILTGTGDADPGSMMAVDGPLPSEGALAAFEASTNKVLEAIKVAGALEKVLDTPLGQMPAGHFLMIPFGDIVIHKWDLAKATNQDTSLDSSLAEECYHALAQEIEGGRKAGLFGPEVQVPITASVQVKLLGLSGRQP
ncbi:MAG: TIGR03086 family metal-binding protein [Dehalococcoidia bacterium]